MRTLVFAIVGLAAALLTVSSLGAAGVQADTPVTVLGTDDVVLHLPVSPSVDRIVADLHTELRATARSAADTRVADALLRVDPDDDLLHQVAASPAEMFDNGEAAATATAAAPPVRTA